MATDPMRLARERTQEHFDAILAAEDVRHMQVLREAGPDVSVESDDGGAAHVVHDATDPAQAAFELSLVTTDDSAVLAALTNAIETEPWRFAERFLMLERAHALLQADVDAVRETVRRLSYWSV